MSPFSNKKGLDIDTTDDEKFELVPCVKFLMDFSGEGKWALDP